MGAEAQVIDFAAFRSRRPRREVVEEPWLDKKKIAAHFDAGTSTVDRWCRDGMPFEYRGGRRRFKVSLCEAWHEARQSAIGR